jgi:hypothetical protein
MLSVKKPGSRGAAMAVVVIRIPTRIRCERRRRAVWKRFIGDSLEFWVAAESTTVSRSVPDAQGMIAYREKPHTVRPYKKGHNQV